MNNVVFDIELSRFIKLDSSLKNYWVSNPKVEVENICFSLNREEPTMLTTNRRAPKRKNILVFDTEVGMFEFFLEFLDCLGNLTLTEYPCGSRNLNYIKTRLRMIKDGNYGK